MGADNKKRRKLLVMRTEEALYEYILSGEIGIGEKLPNEYELGERFRVGRSTIREAVKSLVSEGILEVRRGAGTYVISKSKIKEDPLGISKISDEYELAIQLMEVRLMLEPEIAAMACMNATEEDLKRLELLCKEVEKLYQQGKDHIEKDKEFHKCIAECSKNQVVENLLPIISSSVVTFADVTERKLITETIETHREITDCILRRDSVGAKCAMIMHLTYNRQMILEKQRQNA